MPEKIIFLDPTDLKVHPALKHVPEWTNEEPDFVALVDDIRARGIDQPLICFKDLIVDGRHRWRGAKRLQLKEVPTVQCSEADIHSIIIGSILHRRHFSKGALAYISYPLMADAFEEAKKRQAAQQFGKPAAGSPLSVLPKTVAELAEQCGFSRALFFQARDVHEAFEKEPELREQFEPEILAGEAGIGGILAGIAGKKATKGKAKPKEDQLELFSEAFSTVEKRFKYWKKFDEESREAALKTIRKTVSEMPSDLRKEFAKAIKQAEKEEAQ